MVYHTHTTFWNEQYTDAQVYNQKLQTKRDVVAYLNGLTGLRREYLNKNIQAKKTTKHIPDAGNIEIFVRYTKW